MQVQDLALVGFRVTAVYIGVYSFPGLVSLGQLLLDGTIDQAIADKAASLLMGTVIYLLPMAVAVVLWMLSPKLAMLAIHQTRDTGSSPSLSARELTRVGLIVVGVFVLVTSLPQFVSQLFMFYGNTNWNSSTWPVSSAISCLLAIAVVLGADRIAAWTQP